MANPRQSYSVCEEIRGGEDGGDFHKCSRATTKLDKAMADAVTRSRARGGRSQYILGFDRHGNEVPLLYVTATKLR